MGRKNHNKALKRIKNRQTNKTLDKITYSPATHKQKFTRSLRAQLQKRCLKPLKEPSLPNSTLKFGSFNIRGLNIESIVAVEHILENDRFNVCEIILSS